MFLINKMESSQVVRIKMPSGAVDLDSVVCMRDSEDHWGTRDTSIPGKQRHMASTIAMVSYLQDIYSYGRHILFSVVSCDSFDTGVRYCDVELPGISFAMMRNHVNS